ncbi:MAG TPA: phosphate ABC transporter substrate-binding protein PstS family protein [Thermoanaerobaculia bacterium]|nr:phosphate ABC transporter substrate-binding protein PstS family protein [Thermoanaerobaculia bacterium]
MKRNRMVAPLAMALALCGSSVLTAQAAKVDASIPAYQKASGVSGNVSSVGSDTLNNLMTLWAEGFRKQYPNVRIQIEGKGSSTAPPALIQGTAQFGPMSRAMKSSEIDDFEKKYGYKPTAIRVAVDGLGVFVNKDNPIQCLSMQQVDAIFSKGRACGGKPINAWGQAGVNAGGWANQPLSLYGRNSASGTYGYFKEVALCKGDYRDTVKEQPGSASVVQGVTEDKFGIGYSGIGYKTSGVRAVPLSAKPGGACIDDSPENILSGKYPLSRFLYVYVNKAPNKPLDPMAREFVKYMLSQEGQQVVVKDGYVPVTSKIVQEELGKLQ